MVYLIYGFRVSNVNYPDLKDGVFRQSMDKKDPKVFWTVLSIFFTIALIVCALFGLNDPVLLLTLFVCGVVSDWAYLKVDSS